jgi:predicted RNA-binding Zn-ribbon protein involved in translation (DUF1610 family)
LLTAKRGDLAYGASGAVARLPYCDVQRRKKRRRIGSFRFSRWASKNRQHAPPEHAPPKVQPGERKALMTSLNAHVVKFQCLSCGHDLEQNMGRLKSGERMQCPGCGIGINIEANRLANAAEEMHKTLEKAPPEITIKSYR